MNHYAFRLAVEAARAIPGADGARQIARVYADRNRDHGPVGTYGIDTFRILRDLGGELDPAYRVRRCASWQGVGPDDYVIEHADYAAALDYLNAICDHFWQRIIGHQTREEFARLTVDAGQSIGDAWTEALAHAENL